MRIDVGGGVPRFVDCGHGAYRDQPDRALPIIHDFVTRCFAAATGTATGSPPEEASS